MNFKYIFITTILLFSQNSLSEKFKEGVHYTVLNNTQSEQGVVEYFSFSCPACFAIEPYISELEETLPSSQLRRIHVRFGGPEAQLSQQAFVLLELLGEDHYSAEIFARIHKKRDPFDTEEELIGFFKEKGHRPEKIENLLHSFSSEILLKKMNTETQKSRITQIPTIIIDGKYKINNQAIHSGIDLTGLLEHLNTLYKEGT